MSNLDNNKRKIDSILHTKQAKQIIKTMDKLHFAKSELSKTDKEYKKNTRFIQRLVDRNIQAQKQRVAYFKKTLSVSPHRPSKRDCKSGVS